MSFDLPGVKRDDIKIDFKDGNLTVSGERKSETEKKEKSSYRSERFYGSFSRSFQLPAGVKPDQVEAHYADGVLRVTVPKAEAAKAQQIKIGEGKPGLWDKLLGTKKAEPTSRGSSEKAA
jgi:HSP20 family protein